MFVQSPERMASRSRSPSPAWENDTHITIRGRPRTKSRSPPRDDVALPAPAAARPSSSQQQGRSRPPYGRGSSSGYSVTNNLLAPPPQRHEDIRRKIHDLLGGKPPRGAASVSRPIDYRYDQDDDQQWYDYDGESDSSSQGRGGGEREETPPASPEGRTATFHLDPLSPQDMTVHMSLPVGDDVEGVLEEFSRLRRLGRFSDALELFGREQLGHLIDNRYVLLQYGQCLFEAGWVGELGRLAEQQATRPERDALGISWSLLKWMAEVETPPLDEQRNILEAGMVMLRSRWPALDSTEMNILCAIVSQSTAFVGCFSPDDWGALYEHLIDEGMVWEFRDLVQSIPLTHWAPLLRSDGRSAGSGYSAATAGDRVPEQLFRRWNGGGDDDDLGSLEESTLFALLDVSTTLCLLAMKEADSDARAERWLRIARRHAAELTSRDEGHMVSRPYLRWVIAGVFKTDYRSWECRGQYTFGGTLRQGSFAVSAKLFPFFTPVIYIPSSDEAPEWQPLCRRPDAATVEAVKAVLRAAKEMGDQRVQAGCLHELMHQRAEEANDVMRALHELWTLAGFIEYGPSSVAGTRRQSVEERGAEPPGFYVPRRGRSSGTSATRQKQGTRSDRDSRYFDESRAASPLIPRPESADLPPILETSEPRPELEHGDDWDETQSGRAGSGEAGPGSRRNGRVNFQGDGTEEGRSADRPSGTASSVEPQSEQVSSAAGAESSRVPLEDEAAG
ncbi:hypothetical protein MAPG_10240 [Magnaporthiopsis poae ATCC 64411]|uniref:Uncharacterized protein n=1 Tax=Magnaporthiopsis poae (strain ATCC 64411 / 73-15) TaxID=644358 RepID=A0A0C4EC27_MAGP6|nr:hypothetical protein MAPG_10240 [Magnaporthiopsis poae ATCC 64411]